MNERDGLRSNAAVRLILPLNKLVAIAAAVAVQSGSISRSEGTPDVAKNKVKRVEQPEVELPASIGHIRAQFAERGILVSDAQVGMRLGGMLRNSTSLMFGTVRFNGVMFFYHTDAEWPHGDDAYNEKVITQLKDAWNEGKGDGLNTQVIEFWRMGRVDEADTKLLPAVTPAIEASWKVREDLQGDWECVRNTFKRDDEGGDDVARLRIYRPYKNLQDIGPTDVPLELSGALFVRDGNELKVDSSYLVKLTLPDRLLIDSHREDIDCVFTRTRTAEGVEMLSLRRAESPSEVLEFKLVSRECPAPKDWWRVLDVPNLAGVEAKDRKYIQLKKAAAEAAGMTTDQSK